MTGQDILREAEQLQPKLVEWRRQLHQNPETGARLPQTKAFVMDVLRQCGYQPQEICESGIVATISGPQDNGRVILLRADMDALPTVEKSGCDFASQNGCMHACGHDLHTAMLLGAAALLAQHREALPGTVKLVFQPDEEGFSGAKSMLAAGVLENPAPQAAMALHVHSGSPTGLVMCGKGACMSGSTIFRITVRGKSCHGAMPETGVDPIFIACQIYNAIQEVLTRELSGVAPVVSTIGHFAAGDVPNLIPEQAVMEGTIRTMDAALADQIFRRIGELASGIAAAYRGQAVVECLASAPPLVNDAALVDRVLGYLREMDPAQPVYLLEQGGMGSEDFAAYTSRLPCAYLLLGAGAPNEDPRYGRPMHNEAVVFNEAVLARGAAIHAWSAMRFLSE